MRLWSIHPAYLDAKGLVALWREGLLAQNVLLGKTKGYKNHPQMLRFRNTMAPIDALAAYLHHVADEAEQRGYNFDRGKIPTRGVQEKIPVTTGQIEYEFRHLLNKLQTRNHELYCRLHMVTTIEPHPLFTKIIGPVEGWEIVTPPAPNGNSGIS
ncbi:pyrimidine dimer DNA glycosylase/endonuclease V [Thiovibrio sp. JS02]